MDIVLDTKITQNQNPHAALLSNLEEILTAARPRLLRLAQSYGVAHDVADDIVQETLLEAWRHLNHLRSPDRFDAWLNGICRNVCLRWGRAQSMTVQRQTNLASLHLNGNNGPESLLEENIPDPLAFDPLEELERQDMAVLLDRALGYLPESTREALEMCYLAELPQREAALRLGLTINALEVRLHRARRQLKQILSNELRADAESFGLALDEEVAEGWRETRIWCMFCGRSRLQGLFDCLPDGRVDLRLRCPQCLQQSRCEWIRSGGLDELRGYRSFRPALNRMLRIATDYWTLAQQRQQCFLCRGPVNVQWVNLNTPHSWLQSCPWQGFRLVICCSLCDSACSFYVGGCVWLHPLVQQFIEQHPRWIQEPEVLLEYAGQPAVQVRLADVISAAHLSLLLHRETLQVLASSQG